MTATGSDEGTEAVRPIEDSGLPALYRDFDSTSVQAQQCYLKLLRADLLLIVFGAAASSVSSLNYSAALLVQLTGAACLLGGLLLTLVISRRSFERTWYGARAAAESLKSLSWKFMMRAAPFGPSIKEEDAIDQFTSALREILRSKSELALKRGELTDATDQITPTMLNLHRASTSMRRDVYVRDRIKDQCDWYSRRSKQNESKEGVWFYLVMLFQGGALVMAMFQVANLQLPFNSVSVLAAAASAGIAWLQVKRHQELAQSYALAAHELGSVTAAASKVSSNEQLSEFVNDAETAISREHTMWTARRGGRI
jgi:hypothetical protein